MQIFIKKKKKVFSLVLFIECGERGVRL